MKRNKIFIFCILFVILAFLVKGYFGLPKSSGKKQSYNFLDDKSDGWNISLYNKTKKDNNISFYGEMPDDVKSILNTVIDDKNIVYNSEDYKDFYKELKAIVKKENKTKSLKIKPHYEILRNGETEEKVWEHVKQNVDKLKESNLQPILHMGNNFHTLEYVGDNIWIYEDIKGDKVKVFSTESMDYPNLPYIAISSKLCLTMGISDSEKRGENLDESYTPFIVSDVVSNFIKTSIDISDVKKTPTVSITDDKIKDISEIFFVYKDPSTYIKLCTTSADSGFTYSREEFNHETGFYVEPNCYKYIKYGSNAYFSISHEDIYQKTNECKSEYINSAELYRNYFIKNFKFCYELSASVNDKYIIQVYNNNNTYISLLLKSGEKNPEQIWVSDNEGVILISGACVKSGESVASVDIKKEYDSAKKLAFADNSGKSTDDSNNESMLSNAEAIPQTDFVKNFIENIKSNMPITLQYTVELKSADMIYTNKSDGTNTYASKETSTHRNITNVIVYDNVKYTGFTETYETPMTYSEEKLSDDIPAYKNMFLPEPLSDPENLKYAGTFKSDSGTIEQWRYKNKLVSFKVDEFNILSISYKDDKGEDITCIINGYEASMFSDPIEKPYSK